MSTATAIPSKASWYITVAVLLLVFVVVGVYSSRMAYNTTGYDDEQADQRRATLAKLRETDQKTLTTADWIDKDKGVVRIPVEEAMTQEVPVLAAKPVTIGAPLPAAAPLTPAAAPAQPATTKPAAGSAPGAAAAAAPTGAPSTAAPQPSK